MSMVYCRGCGKEIHESAPICPSCGAPQEVSNSQDNSVYKTYSDVPWYRKNSFAIFCALFFSPALLFALLTGDIYYERKGELRTYSKVAKIVLIIWSLGAIIKVINAIVEA